jgi:hypothetical protein
MNYEIAVDQNSDPHSGSTISGRHRMLPSGLNFDFRLEHFIISFFKVGYLCGRHGHICGGHKREG